MYDDPDQDYLRDHPDLPGHHLTRRPLDRELEGECRRTPTHRPLGLSPDEAYDYDELGQL